MSWKCCWWILFVFSRHIYILYFSKDIKQSLDIDIFLQWLSHCVHLLRLFVLFFCSFVSIFRDVYTKIVHTKNITSRIIHKFRILNYDLYNLLFAASKNVTHNGCHLWLTIWPLEEILVTYMLHIAHSWHIFCSIKFYMQQRG